MKNRLTKLFRRVPHLWGQISAQKQLLLLGLVSVSALVTFTAGALLNHTQSVINHSAEQFGLALAQALARGGAEALSNTGNVDSLKYYIQTEMRQTPAIAYVVFCDNSGACLADSGSLSAYAGNNSKIYPIYTRRPSHLPGVYASPQGYRSLMNIAVPMQRNNETLGICWVGLDNYAFTILGPPHEARFFLVSIFALVWVLLALCLGINYALINRPLKALSLGAAHLGAGNFGYEIPTQRAGKEIDQVVVAFNYMSKELQRYDKDHLETLTEERNKFNAEKNKLQLVLMSIADGVVVCDRDNRVQIVNAAATQLFDREAKDLLGKPLVFCTEGPESPQICQIIQDFTDSVSPRSLVPQVQQIHLGERVIRLHIAPLAVGTESLGSVMIMQDITRQAELERMKNEFIANVSHELRTPITSIKSYVDTLCNHGEKLEPDIYREFLDIINSEADRLSFLVNEVLELSRIEEGDREIERAPHNVREAIEDAIKSVVLMAQNREIEMSIIGEENLPQVVMNRESIERAIINLLSNAIKYTPSGGKIAAGAFFDSKQKEVRIEVKDNGIGIPEDALEHIFDRFYRVERKVHTIKGTGLGLTIVKKIVENHGGRVSAVSALGQGSTFTIHLPVVQDQGASSAGDPPEAAKKSEAAA